MYTIFYVIGWFNHDLICGVN